MQIYEKAHSEHTHFRHSKTSLDTLKDFELEIVQCGFKLLTGKKIMIRQLIIVTTLQTTEEYPASNEDPKGKKI